MDLDEDEEDDDEETEAPPKGSLGIQRHAVAQKEKAAKWARDQLGLKGVEVDPTPAGAKKMSALELAKEEHKIMQRQKLDLRVSTLKGKAKK